MTDEMKALIARIQMNADFYGRDSDVVRLANALEAAQDWKAQAMQVLSEWEATYEAAGSPGRPGQRKAVALCEEIERLRALSSHPDEETEWGAGYEADPGDGPRWYGMDRTGFVIREAAEREVERYSDSQIRLVRRRKAGPWEVCDE